MGWEGSHLCSYFSLEVCFFGADGEVKWLLELQIAPRRRKRQLYKDVSGATADWLKFHFP